MIRRDVSVQRYCTCFFLPPIKMNWLNWIGLLLLKDILDMKYSCSDVVGSQGALVHWLLIRVRVLDLQMCSWGQQHYHLWWSRNLAIWAAPLHYLVDLDGEKDQAVKKMETPSTSPCPGQPWCLHAKPKKSIRYESTSIFRLSSAEEWKLYRPRYCLFGLESCILFQANVYKNGVPFNDK